MDLADKLRLMRKTSAFLTDIWGADKVYKSFMCMLRILDYHYKQTSSTLSALPSLKNTAGPSTPSSYWSIAAPKAASAISQSRYPLRFWGSLDASIELLACLKDLSSGKASTPSQVTDLQLRQLQAFLLLVYHPAEHMTWLDTVAPGFLTPERRKTLDRTALWSSTAATLVMLARSYRRHIQLAQQIANLKRELVGKRSASSAAKAAVLVAKRAAEEAAAAVNEQEASDSFRLGSDGKTSSSSSSPETILASSIVTTMTAANPSLKEQLVSAQEEVTRLSALSALASQTVNDMESQLRAARDLDGTVLIRVTKEIADCLGGLHFSLVNYSNGKGKGLGLGDLSLNILGLWSAVIGGYLKWTSMKPVSEY